MMGIRSGTQLFPLAGLFTLTLALSSCSIGPRTPISVPSPDSTEAKTPPSKDSSAKEDDFRLPEAQWVREDREIAAEVEPAQPSEEQATRVGHALVSIGARPPWETEIPASAPAKAKVNKKPWRLQKTIWVGEGYLYQAAFTPDEKSVLTLSTQSGELFHYATSGKLLNKIPLNDFEEFEDVEFAVLREATDHPQVVITRESATSILDLQSGNSDPLSSSPSGTGVQHSGRQGLYGISDRHTEPQSGSLILQWVTGELAAIFKCDERPDDWALSADGKTIALQYYPSNKTQVIDLLHRRLLLEVASPRWGGSVALSPDGALMALGGESLRLVSLANGKVLAEDTSYKNNINDVRFTANGDTLLVSAYDGKARSYSLPADLSSLTQLPSPQLLSHSGSANVYALGLSKDGNSLVTSSGDKTLKIWVR